MILLQCWGKFIIDLLKARHYTFARSSVALRAPAAASSSKVVTSLGRHLGFGDSLQEDAAGSQVRKFEI